MITQAISPDIATDSIKNTPTAKVSMTDRQRTTAAAKSKGAGLIDCNSCRADPCKCTKSDIKVGKLRTFKEYLQQLVLVYRHAVENNKLGIALNAIKMLAAAKGFDKHRPAPSVREMSDEEVWGLIEQLS